MISVTNFYSVSKRLLLMKLAMDAEEEAQEDDDVAKNRASPHLSLCMP